MAAINDFYLRSLIFRRRVGRHWQGPSVDALWYNLIKGSRLRIFHAVPSTFHIPPHFRIIVIKFFLSIEMTLEEVVHQLQKKTKDVKPRKRKRLGVDLAFNDGHLCLLTREVSVTCCLCQTLVCYLSLFETSMNCSIY